MPSRPGPAPTGGAGRLPAVGDRVGPLVLPDAHGVDVALTGGRTLLVFVPFAFSRTCTGEVAALHEERAWFAERGVRALVVSCDPVPALRAWAEHEGYAVTLLSDFWPHGAAARAFGVLDEVDGFARRGSFLVDDDADGRPVVRWSLLHPGGVARPVAAYRGAVEALDRV